MHPALTCPSCSAVNQAGNAYCARCGAALHPPQHQAPRGMSNAMKLALVAAAILFGSCVACGLLFSLVGQQGDRPQPSNAAQAAATPGADAAPAGTPSVSPSGHLAYAKQALAENYKPHKDPMKTTWGRVDDARRHLEAIPPDAREHAEAQKLLAEVRRRETEIERLAKRGARQLVVEEMERKMLSEGHDFQFSLSGPEKNVLTVKYVLMSRPLVYKLTNESDFLTNMKKAGFTKIIFTDGFRESWTYDL